MFERSRSPSLVWLSSGSIPSVFFDTRDESVRTLLQSNERIQTTTDWDAIIAFAASDMLSLSAIENASRELAYAISLLLNASISFNYISKAVASGDIFVGLSCFRFSLENIVLAGLCCANAVKDSLRESSVVASVPSLTLATDFP